MQGRPEPEADVLGELAVLAADAEHPAVVVALEPLDESPHWRLLDEGELLHVSPQLEVTSRLALPDPPVTTSVDPLPYVP